MSNRELITKKYDKFDEETTYTHNSCLVTHPLKIELSRRQTQRTDIIFISVYSDTSKFVDLRNGVFQLATDSGAISSEFTSNKDYYNSEDDSTPAGSLVGWYHLFIPQFKKVCRSHSLDIRIKANSKCGIHEPTSEFNHDFLIYCRQFYNQSIDCKMYQDSITAKFGSQKKSLLKMLFQN